MCFRFLEQIHIHSDVETLFKFVPKDIVPRDYGGNELPLKDLNGKYTASFIFFIISMLISLTNKHRNMVESS